MTHGYAGTGKRTIRQEPLQHSSRERLSSIRRSGKRPAEVARTWRKAQAPHPSAFRREACRWTSDRLACSGACCGVCGEGGGRPWSEARRRKAPRGRRSGRGSMFETERQLVGGSSHVCFPASRLCLLYTSYRRGAKGGGKISAGALGKQRFADSSRCCALYRVRVCECGDRL